MHIVEFIGAVGKSVSEINIASKSYIKNHK